MKNLFARVKKVVSSVNMLNNWLDVLAEGIETIFEGEEVLPETNAGIDCAFTIV